MPSYNPRSSSCSGLSTFIFPFGFCVKPLSASSKLLEGAVIAQNIANSRLRAWCDECNFKSSVAHSWTDRTKRLAARAPGLDIFAQALVLRDATGWQITDAGRALLASVEAPMQTMVEQAREASVLIMPIPASPPIRRVGGSRRRSRHRAADRIRSSAA
jgi:hypothetical protein